MIGYGACDPLAVASKADGTTLPSQGHSIGWWEDEVPVNRFSSSSASSNA